MLSIAAKTKTKTKDVSNLFERMSLVSHSTHNDYLYMKYYGHAYMGILLMLMIFEKK